MSPQTEWTGELFPACLAEEVVCGILIFPTIKKKKTGKLETDYGWELRLIIIIIIIIIIIG